MIGGDYRITFDRGPSGDPGPYALAAAVCVVVGVAGYAVAALADSDTAFSAASAAIAAALLLAAAAGRRLS